MKSEPLAVSNFREYLRIPSVHPNINYGKNFLSALYFQILLVRTRKTAAPKQEITKVFFPFLHKNQRKVAKALRKLIFCVQIFDTLKVSFSICISTCCSTFL